MPKSSVVPIFDGHNDTLLHLAIKRPGSEEDFLTGREGHIDLPKAKAGGLAGGLFAMFVPSKNWDKKFYWREKGPEGPVKKKGWDVPIAGKVTQPAALNATMAMMAALLRLQKLSKGKLKVVTTHRQLTSAMDRGVLAAVMHIEGVEAIKQDLDTLGVLYEAGLRSLGPVWSRPNAFGHGVPFNFPDTPDIGPGLTSAGKDLVRLSNELGVMVDLSHLNERGFWDVVSLSRAPIVASHSGVWKLCRSTRNLTDDQLRAIGDSGGIVGVNFARAFLRKDGLEDKRTTVKEIVKHVQYIAEKIGVDHVGLGSDFDGTKVPQDMGDASGLPKLIDALKTAGIRGAALKKVAHGNWLRVLKETWSR
ncbi:MAG: membrane dipeptidase [Gemmatimonadetes bacterium]|nr:dipeptidase [Gemmatimonadota bacterium]NNM04892.1 membrane dipeptidase [Gemmatimonadota bacterium]